MPSRPDLQPIEQQAGKAGGQAGMHAVGKQAGQEGWC